MQRKISDRENTWKTQSRVLTAFQGKYGLRESLFLIMCIQTHPESYHSNFFQQVDLKSPMCYFPNDPEEAPPGFYKELLSGNVDCWGNQVYTMYVALLFFFCVL